MATQAAAEAAVEHDALKNLEMWPPLSQPQSQENDIRGSERVLPSVQQLHRLLLLEESAMEADICRCAVLDFPAAAMYMPCLPDTLKPKHDRHSQSQARQCPVPLIRQPHNLGKRA